MRTWQYPDKPIGRPRVQPSVEEVGIMRRMLAPLFALAAILCSIGVATQKVEGWAAALPPLALGVACALIGTSILLGTRRTVAVLVISATALVGGVISHRTDSVQPAAAHTISCAGYPDTYFGRIQRATCIYNQWAHMLYHIEMQQRAYARWLACNTMNAREWFWQGDTYSC